MHYSLKTIFDRFEGERAVFITPFGQEIFWPRTEFSDGIESGTIKYLTLQDEPGHQMSMQNKPANPAPENTPKKNNDEASNELAKKMLEELLNGD